VTLACPRCNRLLAFAAPKRPEHAWCGDCGSWWRVVSMLVEVLGSLEQPPRSDGVHLLNPHYSGDDPQVRRFAGLEIDDS